MARFPWLEEITLDRRASWWGYYETTPDHSPVLGRPENAEGWVNACGFSGHGVQQAAAVGRVIAEEVALGRAESIDIDEFRIERFGRGAMGSERNIV
jgi:sarcosine oxidase subunit beta